MRSEELQALLNQMTLEEKIGELFQLPSYYFDGDSVTGPAAELGITSDDLRVSGSCLSVTGAKKLRQIQKNHMEKHPHHIPMLFMADIINGYHTIFPIPLAQGCTFDPEATEEAAAIAAREAAAAGLHVTFSPMADLCRDARWGRVMESTGEDPFLNGKMAAAMVHGYQGRENDLTEKGRIAACLKHFAGYGAPEAGRDYNTVELSERTLRDDYLSAYQEAVKAGCRLVMTSFNTLNRIPSTGNRWLMRDVLRGEMGFSGVLISDWMALAEMIPHGIAADQKEAARLAIEAGVDIDMSSVTYLKSLKELIEKDMVSEALVNECVLRVLTLKNELGLFENPYKDGCEEDEKTLILCDAHRKAARECAEKSFVLLKNNEKTLPLQKDEKIAFIGPYVNNRLLCGAWSFFGDDENTVSLKEGVTKNYPEACAVYAPGCPLTDPGVEILGFQKTSPKDQLNSEEALQKALQEATALAETADKVILALGEPRDYSGECASRANITLPSCQIELLRRISSVNQNICVVLFNGRPLDLREVSEHAKAILEAWLPGTEGGNAIARILYGDVAPSGKLAMSFPYCVGQVPVYYSHMNTGRPLQGDYRQGRFSSQYLDIPNDPLYPFGFGLSYTEFSCSEITLDKNCLTPGETLSANVTVTNTGDRTGTETLQLYLHDLTASVVRPVRELKGFQKVTLAPGERKDVTFEIRDEMLRFYDIHMDYKCEPGEFEIFIGTDSTTQNKSRFFLS